MKTIILAQYFIIGIGRVCFLRVSRINSNKNYNLMVNTLHAQHIIPFKRKLCAIHFMPFGSIKIVTL